MDELSFSHRFVSFAATYWLHSTVLIGACWVTIRNRRATSHHLTERLWNMAAVSGLVTAGLQVVTGLAPAIQITRVARIATHSHTASENVFQKSIHGTITPPSDSATRPLHNPKHDHSLEFTTHPKATVQTDSIATEARPGSLSEMVEPLPCTRELKPAGGIAQTNEPPSLLSRFGYDRPSAGRSETAAKIVIGAGTAVMLTVAVGALLVALRSMRLWAALRHASALQNGPARDALDALLRCTRIRRPVRLLMSGRHFEPFAYGIRRWTIVLPELTAERLSPEELRALLAHEVAHLVRGDVYWLWIGQVLCTCFGFQPLNFIARRHWQQAAEYRCDDWAIEHGVRSLSLARCLTQIAEWRLQAQSCRTVLPAAGLATTLVQRIRRLAEDRRDPDTWTTARRRRLLNILTAACIPLLFASAPQVVLSVGAAASPRVPSEIDAHSDSETSHCLTSLQAWDALQAELCQLDADFDRLDGLLSRSVSQPSMRELVRRFHHRAGSLAARRKTISLSFKQESEP